jgi:hypothetical protein
LSRIFGKYGHINGKGERVIPPRFSFTWNFAANGLAWAIENGQTERIDRNSQIVLFEDSACGMKVLKNARDEILWFPTSAGQICARLSVK